MMLTLNFLACLVIGVISICRLRHDVCATDKWIRARYTIFVGGACACGLQGIWFGSIPTVGNVIMVIAVMLTMIIDFIRWKKAGDSNETCPLY